MIVKHSGGSYEIAFSSLGQALAALPGDCHVVTDSNVERLYGAQFRERFPVHVVTPGEASKSVEQWAILNASLARSGASRSTTVVALGGGVVGDLAGFVAASYMRGIGLVQIPTTLLAQVDSSVGGKVGIDLPEGKNLVGAFYPPKQVFVCDDVLDTLDERQTRNGMAEVWKYGFILDRELIDALQSQKLGRSELVRRCIDLKRQVVEMDEHERTGERAKLNFGHTVGHAIEKATGYGPVLHGEAISIGMVVEARLGELIGVTPDGTAATVEECLHSEGLPTTSIVLRKSDMLIEAMRGDKKARGGRLAFSLLDAIGSCRLVQDVPEDAVSHVLEGA